MKILIVEDEFHIRNGLIHLIPTISPSYQIIGHAEDGREGLVLARELEPDVVITDIKMPKIDGLKMIEQIQELGLHPVYLVLSGYAEFEYARAAIRLGVNDYLLKPISVDALTQTLHRIESELYTACTNTENTESEMTYSPVVNDMVETICRNYGKHLCLESFSEKYKMTPEYLSTLFAKETSMTFSNYLKNVRMKKAKELLDTTDLKIYEIACRVGYTEPKYFSKVFKEYTGLPAKQYIQQKEFRQKT
jgi:two-component system response regulator YesN